MVQTKTDACASSKLPAPCTEGWREQNKGERLTHICSKVLESVWCFFIAHFCLPHKKNLPDIQEGARLASFFFSLGS
jgi:hypothetical protein